MILNAISDRKNQLKDHESIRLELVVRAENIFVQADKARMDQVISNLLNNAIKFTQERKCQDINNISITLKEGSDDTNNRKEIVVSIKDRGVGIASEIMRVLFTKFATKSEKGTGLGLFISKSIVEAHGGRMG